MNIKRMIAATAIIAAGMLGVSSAQASTITWNLNNLVGVLPTSQNYTSSGITITAAGFTNSNFASAVNLFGKNNGGDEVGLGLNNDPTGQHEISGANIIRIDFTNARTAGVAGFSFDMDSTTAGEKWEVFGSNSATTNYVSVASDLTKVATFSPARMVRFTSTIFNVTTFPTTAATMSCYTMLPEFPPFLSPQLGP
jgi:hypothetical protein